MTNSELPGASRKGDPSRDSLGAANSGPDAAFETPLARPGSFSQNHISPAITRGKARNQASVGGVMQPRPTHWTPIKTSALIALWNEGIATIEIGKRLGVSKNAVVGRVHRLGLPKRPSPLYSGKTPGPSAAEIIAAGQEWRGCLYMFGDPEDSDWRFCQNPREWNPSYCPVHHAKTRQKPGQVGAAFKLPNLTTLDK